MALQQGTRGSYNPILLCLEQPLESVRSRCDFFGVRHIPLGAFFLLDLGTTRDHLIRADPREHKLASIQTILKRSPNCRLF